MDIVYHGESVHDSSVTILAVSKMTFFIVTQTLMWKPKVEAEANIIIRKILEFPLLLFTNSLTLPGTGSEEHILEPDWVANLPQSN